MDRELFERLAGTPFVGREAPLAVLEAALGSARRGRSRWLVLSGEAGLGKTRTAEELADRAGRAGFAVHAGRCAETEGAPPYRPWLQLLRSLSDSLGAPAGEDAAEAAIAPVRAWLGGAVSQAPGDDTGARFRLFESIAAFLRVAAERSPCLLLIDDLQGADEASLALLAFAARELAEARLCVVATRREPLARSAPLAADPIRAALARAFEEIPLPPFGASEVRDFFRSLTGEDPSVDFVEAVRERSDGSPLFVAELARLLALEGRLDPRDASRVRAAALPAGTREVLRQRLRGVSPACQRMLACASVLGRDVRRDLLEPILDPPLAAETGALLDEVLAARLLVPCPGGVDAYRFTHVSVPELLRGELAVDDRARLHGRAGRALERLHPLDSAPALAELAHHFGAAVAAEGPQKAARYAALAGREAARGLAFDDARRLFAQARDLLARIEPADAAAARARDLHACETTIELARASERCGENGEARALFREAAAAAEALGDVDLLARAAMGFAGEHMGTSNHAPDPERVALLERAIARAGDRAATRVPLLARLAIELHWAPDPARRDALAAEAVALARASGDPRLLAQALVGAAWATWGPDDAASRRAAAAEILGGPEVEPLLRVYARLIRATASLELGDVAACDADIAAGEKLASEQRLATLAQFFAALRAMRAILDGRLSRGETLAREALARGQQLGSPHSAGVYASHLAMIRAAQGRAAELVPAFAALAGEGRHPIVRATVAWLRLHAGMDREARQELRGLLAEGIASLPRDFFWLGAVALCGESAALLGERRAARALYAALLPYAERTIVVGMSAGCLGSAARALGLLATALGRYDDAAAHFEAAMGANARLGAWLLVADTREAYAAMLRQRDAPGDAERAEKLEDEARTLRIERGIAERAAAVSSGSDEVPAASLTLAGDGWLVAFAGAEARVPDLRGMRDLAALLERPDEEIHVLDLVGGPHAPRDVRPRQGRDAILDERARREYRERIRDLRAEIDRAERDCDEAAGARARAELEAIERALAAAFGVGRRARSLGDPAERARKAVYNRVRAAIAVIEEALPPLGRHLTRSVRTGTFCAYRPERRVAWRIER